MVVTPSAAGAFSSTREKARGEHRKLFGVCRLRDVPIIAFVSKLYREGRDPFDLLDGIEQSLAREHSGVTPTFSAPTTYSRSG
jgi:peptide subunit release factor RF-3